MKRTYVQPQILSVRFAEPLLQSASQTVDVKGNYSENNEEENGGAGILSRKDRGVWNDEEEEW